MRQQHGIDIIGADTCSAKIIYELPAYVIQPPGTGIDQEGSPAPLDKIAVDMDIAGFSDPGAVLNHRCFCCFNA